MMFRSATKRIAHSSTLPALGGNKDLRTLQDLIIAEKAVLNSLQKLSIDITKASEALRTWGSGEGDDLGDVLIASCAMSQYFADALVAYANHEMSVRDHMKSVRTREERLDDLRRRRKSVAADAESAERKLGKMGPDNKNLQTQTDLLNKLRDEIRIMDTDIMAEEASLGDYKRSSAKAWMGLKFGGLVECSEKGTIVGEFGKLAIMEIPMETTEPGLPRAYYQGHARTDSLVSEARRALNQVVFSPDPKPENLRQIGRGFPSPELPAVPPYDPRQSIITQFPLGGESSRRASMSMSSMSMPPGDDKQWETTSARNSQVLRSPQLSTYSAIPQPSSPFAQASRQSLVHEPSQSPQVPLAAPPPEDADEFGVALSDPYGPRMTERRRAVREAPDLQRSL
ncbi:uncharacterized protein FIBRA_05576 [Fibroporia radiculosa]|uniref:Eisosome component PIL1-domain-containing protein n=1 Tax=Fibroporia radiculosa TaxID=599839 RepID=J4G9R4_9APHY|nr:uncharacterized protein FIBRA_05576 [Fibroporia radiculosa]CCM03443.1 predicted protein [Fibroporia radiculosa]